MVRARVVARITMPKEWCLILGMKLCPSLILWSAPARIGPSRILPGPLRLLLNRRRSRNCRSLVLRRPQVTLLRKRLSSGPEAE